LIYYVASTAGDVWQGIGITASIILILTGIVGGITWIARKVFKLGQISQKITTIESDLKDNIKPELTRLRTSIEEASKSVGARIDEVLKHLALNKVSESKSPRALNDYGKQILTQSGIGTIVDDQLDNIVEKVRAKNPENAYQVQEMVLDVVQKLIEDDKIKNEVEQAAFKSGVTVDVVLLVGGIYIRDKVLDKLDMHPEEIDKHTPKPGAPKTPENT